VFAVVSGVLGGFLRIGTASEAFALANYRYYHVTPTLPPGTFVDAGEVIGRVYPGQRHVHLTEIAPGCGIVDPRRPGGLLANPADTERPTIGALEAFRADAAAYQTFVPAPFTVVGDPGPTADPSQRLLLSHLSGVVDFRAPVSDMPVLRTVETPQQPLMVSGVRGYIAPAGRPARRVSRLVTAFDGVRLIPQADYFSVIAYGTLRLNSCFFSPDYTCAASYVIHTAGRGLDTRGLRNGHYLYCVQAVTISDVAWRRCTPITVAN